MRPIYMQLSKWMQLFGQNKSTSKKAYMHIRAKGINNQAKPTIELNY